MNLDWQDYQLEEPNLTPMIDCVLLLLMFFMMTMKFGDQKAQPSALVLSLPASRATIDQSFATELAIQLDAAGGVWIDGHRAERETLERRLKKLAAERPNAGVRIDSDLSAPYESVAQLVDLCQFVGLTNVALGVRPRPRDVAGLR